jgi:hypothetical protein
MNIIDLMAKKGVWVRWVLIFIVIFEIAIKNEDLAIAILD